MGEFKEGQYVRVLHTDYHDEFPVGSTFKVGSVYGHGVEPEGEHKALFFLNYELEPWQPRVGERVRVVGNDQWKGDGELAELSNYGIFIVSMKTGQFAGKPGGFYVRDLEPILTTTPEQPAALKIEVGKFYKTRDGRKVGPAFVSGDIATFGSKSNHASAVWSDDGRASSRYDKTSLKDDDIIAEWIDEPVAKSSTTKVSNDNAQPKFKVGDRVRFKQSYSLANWRGAKATVIAVNVWGDDGIQVDANGDVSTESEANLEHIANTTTIVALIENGQPKPSSTPHVHASTGAAEKEAKRLAAKFKGQQFGLFTLTTTHEEAAPVYDHKWQNLAVLGLKVDAIKELRSFASLDLVSAKRAVEVFIDKAA